MAENSIPARVQALIRRSIDSIVELEALLLLREYADQNWSVAEAGARLYVSPNVAAFVLDELAERGFLRVDSARYRYAPASAEVRRDIDALAAAYSASLIAVTNLVHAKPTRNVLDFAKAFHIRKEK